MIEHPEQLVEGTSVLARAAAPKPAPASPLLIDQYLPRYDLAVVHAKTVHGHQDTPELREQIRSMLQDEGAATAKAA